MCVRVDGCWIYERFRVMNHTWSVSKLRLWSDWCLSRLLFHSLAYLRELSRRWLRVVCRLEDQTANERTCSHNTHKRIHTRTPTHRVAHTVSQTHTHAHARSLYISGSPHLGTWRPLNMFFSRTTTENCAVENCHNWSVGVFLILKKTKKVAFTRRPPGRWPRTIGGPRTTCWEPLLDLV